MAGGSLQEVNNEYEAGETTFKVLIRQQQNKWSNQTVDLPYTTPHTLQCHSGTTGGNRGFIARFKASMDRRRSWRDAGACWDMTGTTMAVKQQAFRIITLTCLLSSLILQTCGTFAEELKWDENGYVLYCPCMGNELHVADTLAF